MDIGYFYGEHYSTVVSETDTFKSLDQKLGVKSKVLVAAGLASDGCLRIQNVYLSVTDNLNK